jgi:excinuclease ABC subunit B
VDGRVIFYADRITNSMRRAMDETDRRRTIQEAFNAEHGIVPKTIYRSREEIIQASSVLESVRGIGGQVVAEEKVEYDGSENTEELLADLEKQMKAAAANLDFEKAAHLRDEIMRLKEPQV